LLPDITAPVTGPPEPLRLNPVRKVLHDFGRVRAQFVIGAGDPHATIAEVGRGILASAMVSPLTFLRIRFRPLGAERDPATPALVIASGPGKYLARLEPAWIPAEPCRPADNGPGCNRTWRARPN
jgi:hypothetical protein